MGKIYFLHQERAKRRDKSIIEAINAMNEERVVKLLDAGMSADMACDKGIPALHYAVMTLNERLVEILLKKRANPNIRDAQGLSALHIVFMQRNDPDSLIRIATLIKAYGGDILAKDFHGKSALDLKNEFDEFAFNEILRISLEK